MPTLRHPFEPEKYYHFFNHAVGFEPLLIEERNCVYFLVYGVKYIAPVTNTLAYIKPYIRHGTLFYQSIHRRHVTDEDYLHNLIPYFHCNPLAHAFTKNPVDWEQSSFQDLDGNDRLEEIKSGQSLYNERELFETMHSSEAFMQYDLTQESP